MDMDEFTVRDIVSYCDIDTKLVMQNVCKLYKINNWQPKNNNSVRYGKYKRIGMMRHVDKDFETIPLFLNFNDEELATIRIKLPKNVKFHYDLPEEKFEYTCEKFWNMMRVVNLQKLIELLKTTNIGEEKLQQIIKESESKLNNATYD